MVHPGIVVAGVLGVVVTGVVIYSILKEEIDDFLQSFDHQKVPVGAGGHGEDERQQRSDYNDPTSSSSSGLYRGDYELRQRRPRHDEDEDDNEKELDVSLRPNGKCIMRNVTMTPARVLWWEFFAFRSHSVCSFMHMCMQMSMLCMVELLVPPPPLPPSPFVVSNVMPSFAGSFFFLSLCSSCSSIRSGSRLFFSSQIEAEHKNIFLFFFGASRPV